MRILSLTFAIIAILATACSNHKQLPGDLYTAEYVLASGMPYGIQVNRNIQWERADSFPDFRTMKFSYPLYDADGFLTVVMLDSARLMKTMDRYLMYLELQSDTICDIDEKHNPNNIHSWIFNHPRGKNQLQWMATDSLSMYVAGYVHLKAANDSAIDISPALANIQADIAYMLEHLDLSKTE